MLIAGNYFETIGDVMALMAPSSGGVIPDADSDDYAQWLLFIQMKYEEASRRGFWRRLLKKSTVSLTAGVTEVLLPVDFQRANSLYIFYVDGVDLCDPDRELDDQSIFAEVETDSTSLNFGRWKLTFSTAIATTQTAPIWYYCTPPKPTASTDKILLPGDMIAFGALAEIFRTTNLEGSQDAAQQEYENRINTYLAMESIPARNELLTFVTNPRGVDRSAVAKNRYTTPRGDRVSRSF